MELGPREIQAIIPHRWPFLLVDKIVELEGKRAVGIKQVSSGEIYFQGHFPDYPIMPGVLQLEAMAQVGGLLMMKHAKEGDGKKLAYFMAADEVKWRKPVRPGDTLHGRIEVGEVRISRSKPEMGFVQTTATLTNQHGEVVFLLRSAAIFKTRMTAGQG